LLLPGDVFANRRPDPVLQQVESFGDGTISANDAFRPVSRYFDRITRPEQIVPALNRAMQVLTDPAECGPVTLALCQDVQAEAYDYPESFFAEKLWTPRRIMPDADEFAAAAAAIEASERPVIIAGGGVLYSEATEELRNFAEARGIPVMETQAGKSSLPHDHPLNMGSVGVTGTAAANAMAEEADVIIAIGSRLQDFTTGSWALFKNDSATLIGLNVQLFDAGKHRAMPVIADARVCIEAFDQALADWTAAPDWTEKAKAEKVKWTQTAQRYTDPSNAELPSDMQVIGAVSRSRPNGVLVCASGGLPGELHKHWPATFPGSYHLDYGYSTMGYEIAGGLGVKIARPDDDVIVMLGDGSYMMMNSEISTSVMMGKKLTVVVLDNRGFGCINRLQMATGGANFNNLFRDVEKEQMPEIDFQKHAESMGAISRKVASIAELERALKEAANDDRTSVLVIDTDPLAVTDAGGHWWDVAVPEVSVRPTVNAARKDYEEALKAQKI
jgi:3D-(3,5/4)-trihydroxycyclohexane-1,2-dione acylhydrolase (decyclizing)